MALHTPKADRHHTTHDASPPIVQKMLTPTHPLVTEKDKSIHSEHGVIHYPWYFGGTASCASVMCTQPLGVAGLTASLARTAVYSGIRFGMYEKLKEMSTTPTHSPTATTLAALGALSGACGSIASNPADIVCLRMQNDPSLPRELRTHYRNIAHGLLKMFRTEGLASGWIGAGLGASRAALATATQLAGYDVFKREILARTSMTDNVPTHISASCLAGFLSTLICNPVDVVKARVMTGSTVKGHSLAETLGDAFRKEGVMWPFRGLTPALISRGPSTIITFVTIEQMKRVYREAKGLV
ncbi:hypothetical protein KC343_g115 [Hortaea werneckii]|nr:hypothetical protein KC323_g8284 [Hortaea werneckii]KAI7572414.1 hypothetical protein KC317_g782 [Hortaea werneckii]KAI7628568.1 hypothetical protein KC346_g106 [Hortaea werneckii]KAI7638383.1 hypothetical protein KC343_g115 [Hortaea werneckii]KAI7684095.1 hypothetical protein KC319_g117 [Hortaea werneckii]